MEIKIGQRWRYKCSSYHFISEVIGEPFKDYYYKTSYHIKTPSIVVQSFDGHYEINQKEDFGPIEGNSKWTYLEGQDKPED